MGCYVKNAFPKNFLIGQSAEVTAYGGGFVSPLSIIINNVSMSPTLVTDTTIKFIIPTIPIGVYNMIIKNGDGSTWVSTAMITISNNTVMAASLGSASNPIVLPQRIIENNTTSTLNNNLRSIIYTSPASITVDPVTKTAVGTKLVNSAYAGSEGNESDPTTSADNNSANITSPWGTFKN